MAIKNKENKFWKVVKTQLKGSALRFFRLTIKDEEIKESQYLRDLINEDSKKRYDLKNGMQK